MVSFFSPPRSIYHTFVVCRFLEACGGIFCEEFSSNFFVPHVVFVYPLFRFVVLYKVSLTLAHMQAHEVRVNT